MATPVTKSIGFKPGNDFGSMFDFEAQNLNLVALDQAYTVNVHGGTQVNFTLSGWTTDATRFLKFVGDPLPDGRMINSEDVLDRVCVYEGSNGSATLSISGIGAGGLTEFHNMSFYGQTNIGNGAVTVTTPGTVRFINCMFYYSFEGGGAPAPLVVNNASCSIECINCIFVGKLSPGSVGVKLTACAATSKFYHCHFLAVGVGINLNGQTVLLKNCYARGTTAYANKGAATLVTCGSSDATGTPAGLQGIPWDVANWASASAGLAWQDPEPIPTNPATNGGTDISGDAAPFNVSTDIFGRAYVVATPSVGCRQYVATNPRTRHISVGVGGGAVLGTAELSFSDYADLSLASAANLDLVARQEIWILECTDAQTTAAVTFNGWNTDSTHYLHLREREYAHFKRWPDTLVKTAVGGTGYFSVSRTGATDALTVGNIGSSGLIILEGLQIQMNNASLNHAFTNSAAGTGGTVQFKRCRLFNLLGTGFVINGPAGGGNKVLMDNCILYETRSSGGTIVDWNANTLKMHHCTFVFAGTGNNRIAVNMHNTNASCSLKNCYALILAPGTGCSCYLNLTNVTFTKCGSSDATGSEVSLQSLAYDSTNFIDTSTANLYMIPKSTGPLARSGADLSAEVDPLNCIRDHAGVLRLTSNPSIGCLECSAINQDFNGQWTPQSTGINQTKDEGILGLVHFSVDDNLYCYSDHKAGQPSQVYMSSDDGANWTEVYTTSSVALQQNIVGGAEFGGKLYFVIEDSARIVTYDPSGPGWSTAAANLAGATGAPTFATGLFVAQSKLWCVCRGAANAGLYNSANGTTWSRVTLPTYLSSVGNEFRAIATATDDIILISTSSPLISWLPNGASVWGQLSLYTWGDYGLVAQGSMAYNPVTNKLYWIGVGGNNIIGGNGNVYNIPLMLDLTTQKVVVGRNMDFVGDTSFFGGFVKNDLWWGSQITGTPNGVLMTIGGSDLPDKFHGYVTKFNEGANVSRPSPNNVGNGNAVLHHGRIFMGAAFGTAQGAVVLQSPILILSNAAKFDDVLVQMADWNGSDYAASVDVESASSSVAGYLRQTIKTKDESAQSAVDRNQYLRRIRDYYNVPPSGFFKQYRNRVSLGSGPSANREDGFRYSIRVHKHLQKSHIDGPCVVSGLIPHSFIHPSESFAAETASFLSSVPINNFLIRFLWLPTFSSNDLGSTDLEIARVELDGNNYIALVALAGDRSEREYSRDNVYGPHDPILRLKKVRGSVVTATADVHGVYFANSFLEPSSEALDDSNLIEVAHHAGSLIGLRVNRGGVVGEAVSVSDATGFTATGFQHLRYTGVGYYGEPTLLSMVDSGQNEPVQRRLPTYRSDIVRRSFGRNAPAVLGGERDPTGGQIVQNMPYVDVDDFNRPDDPSLGANWGLIKETGTGWSILSNEASCSQAGFQYWANRRPGHKDYIVQGKVSVTFNNDLVGILLRADIDNVNPAKVYSLGVELIQTGAAAASIRVTRFYNDSKEILATSVLTSYTSGTKYILRAKAAGGTITGTIHALSDTLFTSPLATVSGSDDIFSKPGVVGVYGTTGVGQTVSFDDWSLSPNFKQFAKDL